MRKVTIHILWGVCSLMALIPAADAQSPDALFQQAVAANQELIALKKEYQAALEKAPQQQQWPRPEVGVGVFLLPVETRLGPQRARASATQMFPWFGALQAQGDWAVAEARAQFERIAAEELEIRYELAQAYVTLYEWQASQAIVKRNLALLASLKEVAQAKVASGQGTLVAVLRLDLKIEALTQQLQLLANRTRNPLAQINQRLFRDLMTPIQLPDSLALADLPRSRDTLLAQIQMTHPLLRRYTLQQAAANQAIRANTLRGRPSLGVGADYIWVEPRGDASPVNNGRDALQVRATLAIPLDRRAYRAKEREERLRMEVLEARKAETMSRFEAMIEAAYADHEEARLEVVFSQQQIQTTQSAIRILEAEYASQSGGVEDLLQMEEMLLDYELQQLQAVVKSHLAKARIERYLPY